MSAKSVTLGQSNVEQAVEYDTLLPPMYESALDALLAAERERCAKIAEANADGWDVNSPAHPMRIAARASVNMARNIAAEIRKAK